MMSQDSSHNFKKLRNAAYSSGLEDGRHTRYLELVDLFCFDTYFECISTSIVCSFLGIVFIKICYVKII